MGLIKLFGNFFVLVISGLMLLAVGITALLLTLPDVTQLEKCFTTSMYKVRLCPDTNSYVKLKSVSPYVMHAVIAAEDGSFYTHKGFDWHEIQASFETNLRTGKLRRGGSTLTQQLAKNAFLDKEKSYLRKVKEAYLAYAIESKYKKDFILEKYLNVVELGPGIFGVKQAAFHYFQKSPSELHPLEAAYLAFLLPNPKVYSKGFRTGQLTPFARKMIGVILKRMSAFGKLSQDARSMAMANLDGFPWSGLSKDSFAGTPTYSLDAPLLRSQDFEIDEETLEEIVEENAAPASAAESAPPQEESTGEIPSDME